MFCFLRTATVPKNEILYLPTVVLISTESVANNTYLSFWIPFTRDN